MFCGIFLYFFYNHNLLEASQLLYSLFSCYNVVVILSGLAYSIYIQFLILPTPMESFLYHQSVIIRI